MDIILKNFLEKAAESGCEVHILDTLHDCSQLVKPVIEKNKFVMFAGGLAKQLIELAKIDERKLGFEKIDLALPEHTLGIVEAALGIAETGTVVLFASSRIEQLTSLAPSTLFVLLSTTKIVERLEDAFQIIHPHDSPYILFLTGPSVTADIEKEIIYGVHGPKKVHYCLIKTPSPTVF